ncbi:MAG: hypothetical protein JFAIHJKO_02929 [Pyrinomonadaceae bacterium]|nr:hypothetical protein [Pyrinomonadaceae bacterium]
MQKCVDQSILLQIECNWPVFQALPDIDPAELLPVGLTANIPAADLNRIKKVPNFEEK